MGTRDNVRRRKGTVWEGNRKEDQVRKKVLEEMWREEWELKMENEEKDAERVE